MTRSLATHGPSSATRERRKQETWLWIGVLAGPAACLAELVVAYALAASKVGREHRGLFAVVVAAAAAVALGGVLSAAKGLVGSGRAMGRSGKRDMTDETHPSGERVRFMGWGGLALSLYFLLTILAMGWPMARLVLGEEP